jgi:SDR family mycofactocin-dependent oxidoreductase
MAMGRLDGKVALITGGARGQGRSHAIRLAEEGAQIVVSDLARQLDSVPYPLATEEDLAETVRLVEDRDQRCVAVRADARDAAQMRGVVETALSEFGHIDIVSVNHGILSIGDQGTDEEAWDEMIDVNLKGVFQTCRAVAPPMIERGAGGAITLTASVAGLSAFYSAIAYGAAKHGVIGLMRNLSAELAPYGIRVNALCPTLVRTDMIHNEMIYDLFTGGKKGAGPEDIAFPARSMNLLDVPWVEAIDISNALLWLSSDEARYVTGVALPIDAGFMNQPSGIPLPVAELLAGGGESAA